MHGAMDVRHRSGILTVVVLLASLFWQIASANEVAAQPRAEIDKKSLSPVVRLPDSSLPEGSLTIWFDSGVAEFASADTREYQLAPVVDDKAGEPRACSQQTSCTCNLSDEFLKELSKGSGKAAVLLLPGSIQINPGEAIPTFTNASGSPLDRSAVTVNPKRIIFSRSLIEAAKLDAEHGRHELPFRFPDAIDQVTCDAGECRMTKEGVIVFGIDPAASDINIRYTLKPKFFRRVADKLVNAETVKVKLERCSIKIPAHVPLLAGVENHRYFLQVPHDCFTQDVRDLQVETRPPAQAYIRTEIPHDDPNTRLLEIFFERVPSGTDALSLNLFEHVGSPRLIGSVQIPVMSNYRPSFIRLDIEDIGIIDFIPSNRSARLRLGYPRPEWGENFSIEERAGFYTVSKKADGWRLRGEPGVAGNIPLLFAYRPRELLHFLEKPETEEPPVLSSLYSEALYPIRTINIPMPLVGGNRHTASFMQVVCGRNGHERYIEVGELARIDFATRDSCRIIFDCDKIPESAGVQRLRIAVGDLNQIVSLTPSGGLLSLTIPVGERNEYDTILVVVSHDLLSGHYTLSARQTIGEEARYRILLSDSWLKISGTTALPTGMFRFGASNVQGAVPISIGILARATYLQKNGREFPLGLETGLFGTNLSGQPDLSVVAGIGFSIPVLNTNTVLQASLNIHAWLEYAPTRSGRGEAPFAFLFGPSITIGQLSTTF